MRFLFVIFCFFFAFMQSMNAHAGDPSISLDSNVGSTFPPEQKKEEPPKNATEFASAYFKSCTARDHLSLTTNETKTICGCTSANMTQALSFKEMQLLDKDTPQGKDARGKFIAYAYGPCIQYLTEDVTKTDCMGSPLIQKVAVGKLAVCRCASDQMLKIMKRLAPTLVIDAVTQDPMTLDPMDSYFMNQSYTSQRDGYIRQCLYDMAYKKDNKQQ